MSELEHERDRKLYTVVVECWPTTSTDPHFPNSAYVLPTPELSLADYQGIRDAAEKGGCQVRIFTVGNIGMEELKHRLMNFGSTILD
jgi:hypothetical protein